MDQSQAEGTGINNSENVEEEIVVDTLEAEQRDTKDREFVLPGGQIIGLDQAVLQSIERCRTSYKLYSFIIGATLRWK